MIGTFPDIRISSEICSDILQKSILMDERPYRRAAALVRLFMEERSMDYYVHSTKRLRRRGLVEYRRRCSSGAQVNETAAMMLMFHPTE